MICQIWGGIIQMSHENNHWVQFPKQSTMTLTVRPNSIANSLIVIFHAGSQYMGNNTKRHQENGWFWTWIKSQIRGAGTQNYNEHLTLISSLHTQSDKRRSYTELQYKNSDFDSAIIVRWKGQWQHKMLNNTFILRIVTLDIRGELIENPNENK